MLILVPLNSSRQTKTRRNSYELVTAGAGIEEGVAPHDSLDHMNKRALIAVIGLVIVIVGAVGMFAATRPAGIAVSESSPNVAPPASQPSQQPTGDAAAPTPPGVYVEYSPTATADAEGRTILFFHAPWCPQCRSMEADIVAEGVPAGVTIIKVDYDTHQDLRRQYGVTLQTTFVEVDRAGEALQNYVAYEDPRLQAVIDAML